VIRDDLLTHGASLRVQVPTIAIHHAQVKGGANPAGIEPRQSYSLRRDDDLTRRRKHVRHRGGVHKRKQDENEVVCVHSWKLLTPKVEVDVAA